MTVGLIFLVIFLLNIIPAFAPPTWMAMSYLGMAKLSMNPLELALIGATAATLGRYCLAKLARNVIRNKMLSEKTRQNVDSIRDALERRKKLTVMFFLFYAFSPLPSNQVFISYGLTSMPLHLISVPFFLGRLVSYTFWAFTASTAVRKLELDLSDVGPYFGVYFVFSQVALLLIVYAFTKVDWHALLFERKLRWHKGAPADSPGRNLTSL